MRASHILLEHQMPWPPSKKNHPRTKERAEELLWEIQERLKDGEAFSDLASMYSDCSSKADGGDLGRFSFDQMSRSFSEAAFALEVGQLSEMVRTEYGVHLIKRTE
jgi:NIMA-interacting peptidyl-prolyl cis-trans isomerase 1